MGVYACMSMKEHGNYITAYLLEAFQSVKIAKDSLSLDASIVS